MSICIISDHIIILTKFHYNTLHIDQVKPKYEGGASAPKAPPLDPPLLSSINTWLVRWAAIVSWL